MQFRGRFGDLSPITIKQQQQTNKKKKKKKKKKNQWISALFCPSFKTD